MNLHMLDWSIVGAMLLSVFGVTLYAKRYMRGVSDFLAANRLAGRYLLTVSGSFFGVISLVSTFQIIYAGGLPIQWWSMIAMPVGLFLSLTGFIVYRFRQTRALTLAQFFEMRYSRKFRYFAGLLSWIAGVLNYGIFPGITANILIYFLGIPLTFQCGGVTFQTYPCVMAGYLAIAVLVACSGGQITIMLTDFIQGALLMLGFVAIMVFLLMKFQWIDIMTGLQTGVPEGQSLINPFGGSASEDFSFWFFLIGVFGTIYNAKSWQGNSGYNAAAKTPHEAVLSGVIANWRLMASALCLVLIPLVAYAFLHLAKYEALAAPVHAEIAALGDEQLQLQMTVPLVLKAILPIGLVGVFAAIILGSAISCDDSYMHAWGSILIQDVIGPIRNKPFSPRMHMLLLRLSIIGVGLFGFFFSLYFPLKGYIAMFQALTGAIYLGGAGAVIIGGLYWKRGTSAGAWTALIAGTLLGFGGLLLQQLWPVWFGKEFPINGQWLYFFAMLAASLSYIVVSLLTSKHSYDLDQLLHRGKYAVQNDCIPENKDLKVGKFARFVGIGHDFSRFEKALFYATFFWSIGWWGVFVIGTCINLIWHFSDSIWSSFWWFYIWLGGSLGILCTFWIFGGGVRDAFRLFQDLKQSREDDHDDGFVRK